MVTALNMSDEAQRFGIRIDHLGLSQALELPVVAVSAKRNRGIQALLDRLYQAGSELDRPALGPLPLSPEKWTNEQQADLVSRFVVLPEHLCNRHTRALDRVILHPLIGTSLFLLTVLAVFQLLYTVTAPLQEGLGVVMDWVRVTWLQPGLSWMSSPDWLIRFVLDGIWLGVSTVATFMPLIFVFYVVMAMIEDCGYLPRAAFLMDGFMRWLGLDGRSFVLQVIGLQEKLKVATDADAVVAIAKAAGFVISVIELKSAQAEVSEEELEGVAGGIGVANDVWWSPSADVGGC